MPVASCRDCGTVLLGRWCHACGQDSREPLRDLKDFAAEFADAAFSVDGKLPRTLAALVLRPGFLTLEYWDGHRTRWLTPLRLYLVVTFVAFLVFTLAFDAFVATFSVFTQSLLRPPSAEMVQRLPVLMILFLPVSALIIQVFFAGSGRRYLEHLVFALHYHCIGIMTQGVGTLLAIPLLGLGAPMWQQVTLSALVHGSNAVWQALAMRRVYGHGWPGTLWRLLGAGFTYVFVMVGGLTLLFLRG